MEKVLKMNDGRKNNSRPKKEPIDKKIPITIYKSRRDIYKFGGSKSARKWMSEVWDLRRGNSKWLTPEVS